MKAAIFDFDGTLFSSLPYWVRLIGGFLEEHGIEPTDELIGTIKILDNKKIAEYLIQRFELPLSAEEVSGTWRKKMAEYYQNSLPLRGNVEEYLRQCQRKKIRMCIATSMQKELVLPAVKRTGIDRYMDFCITAAEVGSGKENPDIFLYCSRTWGLAPKDCVVFEDSARAAAVARAAGFGVIGVADNIFPKEKEAIEKASDRYIEDFAELLD